MRLKSLPSLREKNRYIVFRVHSGQKLGYFNVKESIWNSLSDWLGEKGLAAAEVWIIKNLWSKGNQTGFIKCNIKSVDQIKVGLSLIHQIGDEKVIFQVIVVTGTIKSGKEKINKIKK